MTHSSNVGAAIVGTRLGKVEMAAALARFGFGRPTGIDLRGEAAGLIPPIGAWNDATLQTISFGQGFAVTPLQMLVAASVIANGGTAVRPHVARIFRNPEGSTAPIVFPPGRRVVSAGTAAAVMAILERAVTEGTGTKAAVAGYSAGKTGTAQKPGPNGYAPEKYIASFIGFAPADAPRLAALVIIDEPHGSYYGGEVAAPLFARIISQALLHLEIAPEVGHLAPANQERH